MRTPRTRLVRALTFALFALGSVTLDQITKAWVRSSIDVNFERIEITPFFDLQHVHNRGIAFGLFGGQAGIVVLGAALVAGLLLASLTFIEPDDLIGVAAVGLVAGGAVGNLVDRLDRGYVTDFMHLSHWPTFNVADVAIVVGVVVLLVRQWNAPQSGADNAPPPPATGGDDADRG